MSEELSDQALDFLLSSADRFVGQGGALVGQLAAAVRQLRRSLVTVNVPGRTFRLDRLSECEDALDTVHVHMAGIEAERDELRALVADFVDPSDCRYDHHGYCQEHGWLQEGVCPNKRAKQLLEDQ